MPLYHYACTSCGKQSRRVMTAQEAKSEQKCPDPCGAPLKREPRAPTATVSETLDNGLMARRVERPADAERLYKERARRDPLKED